MEAENAGAALAAASKAAKVAYLCLARIMPYAMSAGGYSARRNNQS